MHPARRPQAQPRRMLATQAAPTDCLCLDFDGVRAPNQARPRCAAAGLCAACPISHSPLATQHRPPPCFLRFHSPPPCLLPPPAHQVLVDSEPEVSASVYGLVPAHS